MRPARLTRLAACLAALAIASCAPSARMGMVTDPSTGLQHGSVVERNLVLQPSQFQNRRIKIAIRNTSGDPAFDLHGFRTEIERAYAAKGYQPTAADDYGLLLDLNVRYSGQASSNMSTEFAFLGAAAGGIAGYRSEARAGTAIGIVSGLTLGALLGSNVTQDTYIVVADASIGIVDQGRGQTETTVTFGGQPRPERRDRSGFRPFREHLRSGIAAYAGGRSTSQATIAEDVRRRFVRIMSDII